MFSAHGISLSPYASVVKARIGDSDPKSVFHQYGPNSKYAPALAFETALALCEQMWVLFNTMENTKRESGQAVIVSFGVGGAEELSRRLTDCQEV